MIIKLLVEGGSMTPGPAVGQKLGPIGINIGKVIQEVNKSTADFKGVKVPVELDIDTSTKDFTVKVFSPPVSELLKKELKLEKGSGEPNKIKVGNIAIEEIISVAKTKYKDMLEKEFKSAVKSVVGTCVSLGILVENKEAKEIEKDIEEGKFDNEIEQQKTEVSPEKRKSLEEHYNKVKNKQDLMIKKEEEEKAAEEAAKTETATTDETPEEEKKEEKREEKKEEKPEKK